MNPSRMQNQDKKFFFLILLFSLLIKGIITYSITIPNVDAIKYINAAREFSLGNFQEGIRLYPLPLYPFLISCFHYIIPDWFRAAQILSWLPLVLTTIPLYHISKKLFDRQAALWSIAAYSLAPKFNSYASNALRDPLGLLFISMAILFALRAFDTAAKKDFLLVSTFSLLAFLCRIETIFFPLFFIIFCLFLVFYDRDQRKPFLEGISLFIIIPLSFFVVLLLFAPQDFSFLVHQELFNKHLHALMKSNYLANYYQLYDHLDSFSTSYTGNLLETAKHYMWFIYLIAIVETAVKLLFHTNVIPLFFKGYEKYNKNTYFILGIIILFTGTTYLNLVYKNLLAKRYLIIPVFLLFPWVGKGLDSLYGMARSGKIFGNYKQLVIACFMLIFIVCPFSKTLTLIGEKNLSLKYASKWFEQHIDDEKEVRLLSNDVRIPFLSGIEQKNFLYRKKLKHLESYALRHEANMLVLMISKKKKQLIPEFRYYEVLKEFHDQDNIVIIAGKKN